MKNALILHGTGNSPTDNWFPWLKVSLEKKGYFVWVPELPDNQFPDTQKYNEVLLNGTFKYNDETLIIGHSSGAVAALQLLNALPSSIQVNTVYLVAAFKDNLQWRSPEGKLYVEKILEPELNFPVIRKKAQKFILIHSTDDPFVPVEHSSFLAVKLQGEVTITHGEKHFSISTKGGKYKEFPLLAEIMKI
jgi:predicted alpha/beta hydrolase family esterase